MSYYSIVQSLVFIDYSFYFDLRTGLHIIYYWKSFSIWNIKKFTESVVWRHGWLQPLNGIVFCWKLTVRKSSLSRCVVMTHRHRPANFKSQFGFSRMPHVYCSMLSEEYCLSFVRPRAENSYSTISLWLRKMVGSIFTFDIQLKWRFYISSTEKLDADKIGETKICHTTFLRHDTPFFQVKLSTYHWA